MAGRPKKSPSAAKTYMLRIRMTEADRALMDEAAAERGLETSTWARSELILVAKKQCPRPAGDKGLSGTANG